MKPTCLSQSAEKILSSVESDAIEATILGVLIHQKDMRNAVFELYGQKGADKPDLIRSSMIGYVKTGRLDCLQQKERISQALKSASIDLEIGSGVRQYNGQTTMILEADFGRFICAFAQLKPNSALELMVYTATARALAELHPEEDVLAASHDHIYFTEVEDTPGLSFVEDYVQDLFNKGEPKKVAAWHNWYARLTEARPLPKLFR